jgi:hypothetical protein
MKIFLYILSIAVLITGGCLAGKSSFRSSYDFSSVEKVAIVAIEGAVKSETAKDQIADLFAMELLDNGYAPIALAQVRQKLEEQELEPSDLTTIEAATEAGLVLKVPVVLIVNIPRFDDELTMTAKMIDVEDGSIVWMGKGTGKTGRASSGLLMGVITGGSISSEEHDLMGGPMAELFGGETEPALTPEEEQKVQRVVRSICTSLPIKTTLNW